ncbi:LPS assembly lipoprotein LptE [Chitinivibrio alkaliphilus]|uniref:Lipopolysaccharide-assembly n=1 Tax=Chitinivibrio alkaliphilus ACht1 TaxID=1313304 RepID=U7D6X5_9BACT|nr:LPS assembly lipoprotein LptE [Chitinivibrio alkaliphilus]ERP38720.1 hypothetical protein CALK_0738 [Chitinivibrio alkaliphilus ACht1]
MGSLRWLVVTFLCVTGCAYYSFHGTSIPPHIRRVEIPLADDAALVYGLDEELTDSLRALFGRRGLSVVGSDGDAHLQATIRQYREEAEEYRGARHDTEISSYSIYVQVEVLFIDAVERDTLFSGMLHERGVYDAHSESEQIGRSRAVELISQNILDASFPGW